MEHCTEKAYIFGGIFTLANRLQLIGDKFDPNLTTKQWFLLAGIAQFQPKTPTISEVSAQLGSSRQNVKKMASILEREGFLVLQKDSKDARILKLCLTDKCETYFKQREAREDEFLDKLFTNFEPSLLYGLYQGLNKLAENVMEMEKDYVSEEKE